MMSRRIISPSFIANCLQSSITTTTADQAPGASDRSAEALDPTIGVVAVLDKMNIYYIFAES
jgi:hypothetical protein